MTKETKILVLQFKEDGKIVDREYFFASVAAIYELYNEDAIGAVIGTVYNSLSTQGVYDGKQATIRKDVLYHSSRPSQQSDS